MDASVKLNATEELNLDELDAVAGGWFKSMDTTSKVANIGVWSLPFGGIYSAAAITYDILT